jgi:hypothetical protein
MQEQSWIKGQKSQIGAAMLAILGILLMGGCSNNAKTGALIGSGVGAATGAVIGNQSDETGAGAAIGTAVGAGTGYIVGNEMDKNEGQARVEERDRRPRRKPQGDE